MPPEEILNLDQGIESLLGQQTTATPPPVVEEPVEEVSEQPSGSETQSEEVPGQEVEASEGDTVEEVAEEQPEEDASDVFVVKVDGKDEEVPLQTLIQRYQLQQTLDKRFSDLNQQKATVTEQIQTAQQEITQAQEARDRYLQIVEDARQRLGSLDEIADPPVELSQTDPVRYNQMKIDAMEKRQRVRDLEAERERVGREKHEEFLKQHQERVKVEMTHLLDKVPEWQDPAVRAREQSEVAQYAVENMGFSPNDVAMAADHRYIVMIRKAKLYDELMANAEPIVRRKIENAPSIKSRQKMKARSKTDAQKANDAFVQANKRYASGDPMADPVGAAVDLILARKPAK